MFGQGENEYSPGGLRLHGIDHIVLRIKRGADMSDTPTIVTQPLVIMFKDDDGKVLCHLYPDEMDHRHYGLLVCDLVRHVAAAFKVAEKDVWDWVDKERNRPTTELNTIRDAFPRN
jgi:hypothetical protein